MDYTIKYWVENTDFGELKKRIGDRKIAIWGAYATGKRVQEILTERGLSVGFYIDGHKEASEYGNLMIRKPDKEIEKDVYIFIAVMGIREEIIHYLKLWHMKEPDDYTYISKILPRVVITECEGGYADYHGNRLECDEEQIQCKIEFKGFNSRIKIGRDFIGKGRIVVESDCEVIIGDGVHLFEDVMVEVSAGGKIEIGNGCLCNKDAQIACGGAEIIVGNYVTIGERFFCSNSNSSVIKIGNDCMFSLDVSIIVGGQHSIFNLETEENVTRKRHNYIKIGNHVWIGKNAVVLHNADIGNGCIIGASSVVKIKAEENCVIAGNPAKVIKTNHTWERRNNIEFRDI